MRKMQFNYMKIYCVAIANESGFKNIYPKKRAKYAKAKKTPGCSERQNLDVNHWMVQVICCASDRMIFH